VFDLSGWSKAAEWEVFLYAKVKSGWVSYALFKSTKFICLEAIQLQKMT